MKKLELGVDWERFGHGNLAVNTRTKTKEGKFFGELMEHGLTAISGFDRYGTETAYTYDGEKVNSVPMWRIGGIMVHDYSGCATKAKKASSKGFCSRKKGPSANVEDEKKTPYADERRLALEDGALTSFESQLLGSLGICANELVQIEEGIANGESLFQWGDSQKVLKAESLKSGASKRVLHISEHGGNGDGFVVKWNYSDSFLQVTAERDCYAELEKMGKQHMVSSIYRFDSYKKGGIHLVRNVNGKACEIVRDGVLYSEYCHSVGSANPTKERIKELETISWDTQQCNMGRKRNGSVVLVDYGVQ